MMKSLPNSLNAPLYSRDAQTHPLANSKTLSVDLYNLQILLFVRPTIRRLLRLAYQFSKTPLFNKHKLFRQNESHTITTSSI